MRYSIIYILLLFICSPLHAQYMQTINCDNGLSNRRVFQIVKDKSNFMWFATRAGFDRYDGKNIRHYALPQTKDSRIFGLATTHGGDIWGFSSHGNLYYYDKDKDRYNLELSLDSLLKVDEPFIFKIYVDSHERIWMCSSQGLYCYFPQAKKFSPVTNFVNQTVYEINDLGNGQYALFTGKGFCMLEVMDKPFNVVSVDVPEFGYSIAQIRSSYYDALNKTIWLGSFTGELFIYQLEDQKLTPVPLAGNHYAIRAMTADDHDNIIIGTDGGGILFIDRNTCQVIATMTESEETANDLISKNVYDIYSDGEGKIWIGTYNRGICVYNPHTFDVTMTQHERLNPNSLAHSYVNALLEDKDGDMWYANNKGVSVFFTATQKWKHFFTQDNSIMSLCEDRNGNVWAAGFSAGVYSLNKHTGNMRHFTVESTKRKMATNDITAIYADRENDIWISQFKGDVLRYNPQTDSYLQVNLQFVNTFIEKDAQTLFAGTRSGLYQINRDNNKVEKISAGLQVEGSLDNPYINTMYLDNNGRLWMGTEGGLSYYDILSKSIVNVKGFESYTICGIQADQFSQLWISTHMGLIRMNPQTGQTYKFGIADGFLSEDFNTGAYTKRANGNLVFGSPVGAVEFSPETATTKVSQPKLYFDQFSLFNRVVYPGTKGSPLQTTIDEAKQITLKYDQNTFSVSFVNINFSNPDKWIFTWKLEGFDREWSRPSSQSAASYSNLESGRYKLLIKVFNENDPSVHETRSIDVVVQPPFWNSVYAYIFYILLALWIAYMLYRYFTNRMAERSSRERTRFFIDTAHNIRTPITLIKAPLNELEHEQSLSAQGRHFLDLALRNVEKLNTLINQLIDLQRAESNALKLTVTQCELDTWLKRKMENFLPLADQKKITLSFEEAGEEAKVWFDTAKMDTIFDNLLSNAIKYSPDGSMIRIISYVDDTSWGFTVSDNGIGIPVKAQKHLFKRYYRADNAINTSETGSGLGLLITRSLVSLMQGKISLKSEEGKGSTFILRFKNGNQHFLPEEIMDDDKLNETENAGTTNEEDPTGLLPELLLVEDNIEMCEYLSASLSSQYHILVAHNGVEAMEVLKEHSPQIVLSDVMMPLMRGDELCRRMKSDMSYCHIPIILITALDEKSNIIAGYEAGAEDYILKPFDIGILKVKIESILKNRLHLQEAFTASAGEEKMVEYANNMDNEFMQKSEQIIERYLSDVTFSINTFCSELGMSRTSVYNKLKALTGLSPNDFIKIIRLKKAAALLREQRYYVSEVAYLTGFPDVKYFSVAFKKQFGVTPKKYSSVDNTENEN
ncbi:two-component regulator propeller domain-containing protein [Bacteroides sp.]|uniref:two-component regulator propeller domain-containing protein n=1 Tax=Bacteroides sp. TaxID=29523 RepID=UPI0025C0B1F1|nr:two-component regulator propeller domain-containing protein [Bacteroides sp.]